MKVDITGLSYAVVTLLMFVVSAFIIPFIRARVKDERFDEILKWIEIAVEAAEMIFRESGMGAKKKEYVIKFIESKGYTIDAASLDNMIESAVLKMKNALRGGD